MKKMTPALLGTRYSDDGMPVLLLNDIQRRAREDYLEKVENSLYTLEFSSCETCRSENFKVLALKDRYGISLSVVVCEDCGLVQTNPRMDEQSYAAFYDAEYRRLYVGEGGPTSGFFSGQMTQGRHIANFIRESSPVSWLGKRVLEVGCGAGGILKHFRDLGAIVSGCDLGAEYLRYGRDTHGLDLTQGPLSSLPENQTFDVIIYSHVFEHVSNPKAELLEVSKRLVPGGLLYLEVPGIHNIRNSYRSDFLRLLQNAHIFHFTLTSLNNLVGIQGFRLVAGNEHVRAIYRYAHDYKHEISNDYNAVMDGLRRYEKMRPFHRFSPSNVWRVIKLNFRRLVKSSKES